MPPSPKMAMGDDDPRFGDDDAQGEGVGDERKQLLQVNEEEMG